MDHFPSKFDGLVIQRHPLARAIRLRSMEKHDLSAIEHGMSLLSFIFITLNLLSPYRRRLNTKIGGFDEVANSIGSLTRVLDISIRYEADGTSCWRGRKRSASENLLQIDPNADSGRITGTNILLEKS